MAVSLLLVSMRIFNKNLLVPSFPFDSGKITLVWAKLDKNKSCRGHVTIHVKSRQTGQWFPNVPYSCTLSIIIVVIIVTVITGFLLGQQTKTRENHSWAQRIPHTSLIWFTQVHVENRFLSPTLGPVYLNHWKCEFLTKHYHDQGSHSSGLQTLSGNWNLGPLFSCLKIPNALFYWVRNSGVNYPFPNYYW